MRERLTALIAVIVMLAVISPPRAAQATAPAGGADIFDELQQNAWYLPTGDGKARLYVTSFGRGPTVIVLHGGPGNDFNYLVDWLRPLAGDYHFVFFEQRGSLLSPVPSKDISSLTMTDLVDDIDTLRKALGQEKVVLFGHSFGSLLAEFYFQAHPQNVAGLVLTGAMPPSTDPGGFEQFVRGMHGREDALRNRPVVKQIEQAAGVLSTDNATLTPQEHSTQFKIENASIDLYHVDRWQQFQGGGVYYNREVDDAIANSLPSSYNILPVLNAHPIPIHVIQGDHDYVDPSASTWVADTKGMNDVRVYVLKDASHYGWIDAPDEFDRDLSTALGSTFR